MIAKYNLCKNTVSEVSRFQSTQCRFRYMKHNHYVSIHEEDCKFQIVLFVSVCEINVKSFEKFFFKKEFVY